MELPTYVKCDRCGKIYRMDPRFTKEESNEVTADAHWGPGAVYFCSPTHMDRESEVALTLAGHLTPYHVCWRCHLDSHHDALPYA